MSFDTITEVSNPYWVRESDPSDRGCTDGTLADFYAHMDGGVDITGYEYLGVEFGISNMIIAFDVEVREYDTFNGGYIYHKNNFNTKREAFDWAESLCEDIVGSLI